MPSSFATLAIGRDVSITIFTASSLNSGEKLFFGRGKTSPFQIVHLIGWTVRKARGTSVRAVAFWVRGAVSGHAVAVVRAAWTLPAVLVAGADLAGGSGAGGPVARAVR